MSELSEHLPGQGLFDEAFLRKLERLALLSRQSMVGQLQGERRSPKRGQSVEFADFRAYVPGDDFRRIDWNAYARLEKFFIKLFVEEEDITIHFLIDASRSMDWGQPNKLEYAIRAGGAIAYVALVGLDRVSVTALGNHNINQARQYLPPIRGKRNALSLFAFLQALQPEETPRSLPSGSADAAHSPAAQLMLKKRLSAYAVNNRPGPLLLFSDLMNDGWQDGLNALAAHGFEISIVHLLSPDEVNPDFYGDFKLIDSENGAAVELTADFETLEHYHQTLGEWQESWRRFCAARAMHYIPISSALSLEELLFAHMRQRGVLR